MKFEEQKDIKGTVIAFRTKKAMDQFISNVRKAEPLIRFVTDATAFQTYGGELKMIDRRQTPYPLLIIFPTEEMRQDFIQMWKAI